MQQKTFFEQLKRELGNSSKAKRYLEELSEHLDDTQENAAGVNDAPADPLASLGSPENLRDQFHSYLQSANFWHTFAQSLLIGILSAPLYLAALSLVHTVVSLGGEPSGWAMSGLYAVYVAVGFGIIALLIGVLYWRAIPVVFRYIPGWKAHRFWIAIMAIPPLLGIATFWAMVLDGLFSELSYTTRSLLYFEIAGTFLTLWYGTIMFRFAVKDIRRESRVVSAGPQRKTKILAIILLAYLAVTQLSIWWMIWFGDYFIVSEQLSLAGFFFHAPRSFFEVILSTIGTLFVQVLSGPVGYWVLIGTMIVLVVIIAYQITDALRHSSARSFPWIRLVMAVYIIFLLAGSPAPTPNLEIAVPFSNLTDRIGQREFGPFYRFVRYIGKYDHVYSQSYVMEKESVFRLGHGRGPTYELADLRSTDAYRFSEVPREDLGFAPLTSGSRIADLGLQCITNGAPEADPDQQRCDMLIYRDTPILHHLGDNMGWLNGAGITNDRRFLIVEIRRTFSGGFAWIYLLDISSIQ